MAITQTRMLALIKIADDFKSQLLSTNRAVLDLIHDLPRNPTPEELLETIQSIQHFHLQLSLSPQALEILATERAHFKLNKQRNTRQMIRARRKRGMDLDYAPPRNTAPDAIKVKESNYSAFYDKPEQKLFTGAAAQYNSVKPLSEEDLNKQFEALGTTSELIEHKIKINADWTALGQPAPFPDIYGPEPLTMDHKIHLGIYNPNEEDDSIF